MGKPLLIPEWANPDAIALVWPEHLRAGVGSKLKNIYKSIIQLLVENDQKVLLICNDRNDRSKLSKIFPESVNFLQIDEVADIWVRDFGPLFLSDSRKTWPVNLNYKPSYVYNKTSQEIAYKNRIAGRNLAKLYNSPRLISSLILDGGNFIHNGLGAAIITNRIISDNEHLFEHEIREILSVELGIDELHIVPSEPGDDTGHIDGLVRFLDPNTLAVSRYPDQYNSEGSLIDGKDIEYSKIICDKIASYLGEKGFSIIRLENSIPKKGVYKATGKLSEDGTFENATGNYMNFLRAGNTLFIPYYSLDNFDRKALDCLNSYGKDTSQGLNIVQTNVDLKPLAEFGGILNCVSLQLYSEWNIIDYFLKLFIEVAIEPSKTKEPKPNVLYIARLHKNITDPRFYQHSNVVQINFGEEIIHYPQNLQKICKYRNPIFIESDSKKGISYFKAILDFHPKEIRKIFTLLYSNSDNNNS